MIVNDLSLPHDSVYRPGVRWRARDGFCPIGSTVVPRASLPAAVDALGLQVLIDGALVHRTTTGERIRGAAQLLADVTEFMTLQPGDVLMLGGSLGAPLAVAGQVVAVEIDGLGRLSTPMVAEAEHARAAGQGGASPPPAGAAPMPTRRSARVACGGAVHGATPHPQGLRLDDGRVLAAADVVWPPPFEVGTIIALGLNHAPPAWASWRWRPASPPACATSCTAAAVPPASRCAATPTCRRSASPDRPPPASAS